MAASFIPEATGTSMEDFISCSICLETFTDPKILNCHHTFCEPCLRKLPAPWRRLTCPTCRQVTPLPATGRTKALTTDFRANQLIDIEKHQKLKHEKDLIQSNQKEERNCDFCKAKAELACLDCDLVFCSNCKENHKSLEDQDGHSVIPFTTELMCDSHSGRLLVFFCDTCSHGLCKLCVFMCPKTHKHRKMREYCKYKIELEREIAALKFSLQGLKMKQEEVKKMKATKEQFLGLIRQVTEMAIYRIQNLADEYLRKTTLQTESTHDENHMCVLIKDHEILKRQISEALLQSPCNLMKSFDNIHKNIAALSERRLEILPVQPEEIGNHNENDIKSLISAYKNKVQDELRDIPKYLDDFSNVSMAKFGYSTPSKIRKQRMGAKCQQVYAKSGNGPRSVATRPSSTWNIKSKMKRPSDWTDTSHQEGTASSHPDWRATSHQYEPARSNQDWSSTSHQVGTAAKEKKTAPPSEHWTASSNEDWNVTSHQDGRARSNHDSSSMFHDYYTDEFVHIL